MFISHRGEEPGFTLQRTNTENCKRIFPEKEFGGHRPNFHIHVSVSDLYIPRISLPVLLQEILYLDRSWEYINCSQTYECFEIETEAAQFPECINGIFVAVYIVLRCKKYHMRMAINHYEST